MEDYLARERQSDVRHEYVDGELFAMIEESRAHGIVVANLVRELGDRLHGGPCRVGSSDMKVRSAPGSCCYYPDIVVSRNDEAEEPDLYIESRPTLLVEVLSATTAATDRREKRVVYQSMPSVREYLLIDPEIRTVEVYFRDGIGWSHRTAGEHETLALASLAAELPVADVFEGVRPGTA